MRAVTESDDDQTAVGAPPTVSVEMPTNVEMPAAAAVTNPEVPVAPATVVELPAALLPVDDDGDGETTERRDPRQFQKARAAPVPLHPPHHPPRPAPRVVPEVTTGSLNKRKRLHPLLLLGALFALLAFTLLVFSLSSGSKAADAQGDDAKVKLKKLFDW
jgi:hypothetical protein